MRFFNGLTARQLEKQTINAISIREGDFVSGDEVDHTQVDLGMVVVYYKSGNFSLFNKYEKVQILRESK